MSKIFISYRRNQAEFPAGALARGLRERFGEEQVFRDKEDLGAGRPWRDQIAEAMAGRAVLLVLIGTEWVDTSDVEGHRRLAEPDDPVANEIRSGLKAGSHLIPVLLGNAEMPSPEKLPPDLAALAGLQAARLRDADWSADLAKLCAAIESLGISPRPSSVVKGSTPRLSRKAIWGVVCGGLALAGAWGADQPDKRLGVVAFAVAGLILGIWAWADVRRKAATGIIASLLAVISSGLAVPALVMAPTSKTLTVAPGPTGPQVVPGPRVPSPTAEPNLDPGQPVKATWTGGFPSGYQIEPCGCRWLAGSRAPAPLCASQTGVSVVCPKLTCPNGAPMTRAICE